MMRTKIHLCPRCHKSGYNFVGFALPLDNPTYHPEFKCTGCGHFWSYGDDGGPYIDHIQNKEEFLYARAKQPT
jgi:hypothetical protein